MSRLADALDRIRFAREYSSWLVDSIPHSEWFRSPDEVVTHLAWQVGHMAIAQYRLCLVQLRGPKPEDDAFFPPKFLDAFKRDSVPVSDPASYPSPSDIRTVYDAVHTHLLEELAGYPDADLDSPVRTPHRLCKTKIDSVRWCSAHELVHAGQVGLLRRLFGEKPLW
ncbi:MAG TPA: DinB family protein [Fimbriiglobus sp.]|jgi:hypothetical protein